MTRIVLTEEQARIWKQSHEEVEMCDSTGTILKTLPPLCTEEEFLKAKAIAAKNRPRYSGKQVQETLRFLEDTWQREGPFGEQRLQELLQEWRQRRQ